MSTTVEHKTTIFFFVALNVPFAFLFYVCLHFDEFLTVNESIFFRAFVFSRSCVGNLLIK
jgi:hypothetical protein